MSSDYNFFEHPLIDGIKIVNVDDQPVETIGAYEFAAMILDTICDPMAAIERPEGLNNAQEMAIATIKKSNHHINYEKLLAKCKEGNTAARMQAQCLIANGLEVLIEEQLG